MKINYWILIVAMAIISSCNKVEINKNDYLIFGHFYGFCFGEECIETFKLTSEKLFEDLNDNYSDSAPFNFIALGNDKFNEVKNLIDFIPAELLTEDSKTFGCPDCADQGGLRILYYKNGKLKKWRIDQNKSDVPDFLHDFMDKVNENIQLINN